MPRIFTRFLGVLSLAAGLAVASSCTKDLDQTPGYQLTADQIYKDGPSAYAVLARLYATYAVTGTQGPAGAADVASSDEGASNYLRQYWQAQEITTDEAVLGWGDNGVPQEATLTWNADNDALSMLYSRIFYQIALCNDFLRQTTDAKLSSRGFSSADQADVKKYRAEARFLRALSYWHAIDMFGGGPFATEANNIGEIPQYMDRKGMFSYVDGELKDLDASGAMLAPRAVYARADQGTLWTLMTKLYLNAEVYTGASRATDAITYANKVLSANYALNTTGTTTADPYQMLFMADNNSSLASREIIFPITFDGQRTQSYGGMTYLLFASTGRAVTPASKGINGGWLGLRTKPNLATLFGSATASNPTDLRSKMFVFRGQNPNVDTLGQFSSGPLIAKYRNITSTGKAGSNPSFPDTDFPMFRLADVMLMYAEAVLRGGTGGTQSQALAYVNAIRARAGVSPAASIALADILDERGRELFWEGHRRTDLIRFGVYTKDTSPTKKYTWPFKGSTTNKNGQDVDDSRKLFPIPNSDRTANPNLPQNPGY